MTPNDATRALPGLPGRGTDGRRRVSANPALHALASSASVLLLQGPVGPFYDRMARWLALGGATVNRVVFQGGDRQDCTAVSPIEYAGTLDDWPAFLGKTMARLRVDCVVLFGQTRHYHTRAMRVIRAAGARCVVMEEGYFRPGFATMELDGVNGYSTTLERFTWQPVSLAGHGLLLNAQPGGIEPDIARRHFQSMAWHAARHYAAMDRSRRDFRVYEHHRAADPWRYAHHWLRSWARKLKHRGPDARAQQRLFADTRPYFFVPLQHDGDAQITHHSPFGINANFITAVMRSFAIHAPLEARLVFRQHPHSRGGEGHADLIAKLADDLGIKSCTVHLVEGDTPALAEKSAGVVVINSTVGLQALERGAPVLAMGDALYNRRGIVFDGTLAQFWRNPAAPDPALTQEFLLQLKNLTQVPASLYADAREPLRWTRAGIDAA